MSNERLFTKTARFLGSFLGRDYPEKMGNSYFYLTSMADNIFGGTNPLKHFLEVPEVNAIINIKARAISSWNLSIESKTTGLPVTNNESLVRIIKTPNWFQAQKEFWRQSDIFHSIYGNEYIYFLTPFGMPNSYKAMFTLNPAFVEIEYKPETQFFLDGTGEAVKYFYNDQQGTRIELDKSNLIHLNDNRVQPDNMLKGTSKLDSLEAPIQNIRAAYKKRNIALNMPIGVLSNNLKEALGQVMPMDSDEKEKVQQALREKGSGPIITNLPVDYSAFDIDSRKMGLFEETKESTLKICDAYGIPYEVLASQKGQTYANLKEGKKQMYEEGVIPDAEEKTSALNQRFDGKAWHLVGDFNHLPVFAEDQKQRATSMKQAVEALSKAFADNAITLDQYKNELAKFGI